MSSIHIQYSSGNKRKIDRPILVIDGFNNFIKYYMANPLMTNTGIPVGGVEGFIKFLHNMVQSFAPSKLIVVWENSSGQSRRKRIYEGYKSNRTKTKEDFQVLKSEIKNDHKWMLQNVNNKAEQLHLLVGFLKYLPVQQIFLQNTEADDIISYLVQYKFKQEDCKKIIISSDKDFYQLLEHKDIQIYDPLKKIIIDSRYVLETFNISARNFLLARTVIGDESDTIPGIKGVGLKTLAKRFPELTDESKDYLIQDFIDLSKEKMNLNKSIKVYETILNGQTTLERNWKLMHLGSNNLSNQQIQKIDFSIDNFEPKIDKLGLIKSMINSGITTNINFDQLFIDFKSTLFS